MYDSPTQLINLYRRCVYMHIKKISSKTISVVTNSRKLFDRILKYQLDKSNRGPS